MQRQLRLGDILDDYCPRERRVTNHAVVAMIGSTVKQTRCTTCEAEHEYKHAKVPRQRRKSDTPSALYSQVAAAAPKRVAHDEEPPDIEPAPKPADTPPDASHVEALAIQAEQQHPASEDEDPDSDSVPLVDEAPEEDDDRDRDQGPVHRPLIRASLPRQEGQPPPPRQAPEFTIRQPGGRPNRFRPRHQRGGQQQFPQNRSGGNSGGSMRGGMPRNTGRPPMPSRLANRHGPGRKRSK
jgi:hypothetical protein